MRTRTRPGELIEEVRLGLVDPQRIADYLFLLLQVREIAQEILDDVAVICG